MEESEEAGEGGRDFCGGSCTCHSVSECARTSTETSADKTYLPGSLYPAALAWEDTFRSKPCLAGGLCPAALAWTATSRNKPCLTGSLCIGTLDQPGIVIYYLSLRHRGGARQARPFG